MNLISCDHCGIVINTDKTPFPSDIPLEGGAVDISKGIWSEDRNEYVPFIYCPVCQSIIVKDG